MAAETTEQEGYSVEKLRRQYLDFAGTKSAEIEEQRTARHYYHADQWTAAEQKELQKRRQPIITANRVSRKINGIVGLVERLRQDPKAYPRTPKHEGGAEIATAAIRYTLDASDWQPTSSEVARSGAINGIGGIELSLEKGDHDDPEVAMALVDTENFFYDPRSVRLDFSDARYMGVAKWVDQDVAEEMFPDRAEEITSLVSDGAAGMDTSQLQDREKAWVNTEQKRVFLVEHWYIWKGEWRFCFYVASQELQSGASPFKDEKGKTFCRFVMFSANVDHDGDRYGFVRDLRSLQDEVNARRSKALHLLNTRRIIAEEGAVANVDLARREAVRPDGFIEKRPGSEFAFDDAAKMADLQGQLEFLAEAKTEIENFGPNPAVIGEGIENKSGRAIALLQQAGIAELGPFILAYRGWKVRVYRAVWNIIQAYWTGERWIRVTDEEGEPAFLQINGQQTDDFGRPVLVNALGALDVDLILDEGPDTVNIMQDIGDTLTALAQKGAAVPPQVIIKVSQLPGSTKKEIIDLLDKAQQPDPNKQAMEAENAKAEIGGKKAKAMKDFAGAVKDFAEVGAMPDQIAGQQQAAMQPQPEPAY